MSQTELNGREIRSAGYVAIGEAIAEAGAIVYWRLSGDLDLARLRVRWEEQGLPESLLPEPRTPAVALRRAMGELASGRRLVRPLEGRKGWALVTEHAVGNDLAYSVGLTVHLEGVTPVFEPADHGLISEVVAVYQRNLGEVTQADVGGWLCELVSKVDAVGLRDTGGIYFVPRHGLEMWRRICAALGAISAHVVFAVPALPTDDTVAAVLDAVTTESEARAKELEDQLLEHINSEGKFGVRALRTKLAAAEQAEAKIGRYESVVGQKMEALKVRLERVRGGIAAALLSAEAT